jgi:hypothetical protein
MILAIVSILCILGFIAACAYFRYTFRRSEREGY